MVGGPSSLRLCIRLYAQMVDFWATAMVQAATHKPLSPQPTISVLIHTYSYKSCKPTALLEAYYF